MQPVALILLLVLAVLVGSRWYLDRFGTRPTEHNRNAAHRVDLNRASRNELMQLPGVGPATADRIVAHRESNGRFSKVEDLDQIDACLARLPDATAVRSHFHIPIFREPVERGLSSTILDSVAGLRACLAAGCTHIAVETYTWPLLAADQRDIRAGTAAELRLLEEWCA